MPPGSTSNITCSSQFDDIFRCASKLMDGGETELITFLESVEECRQRWLEAQIENESLKGRIKILEAQLKGANTHLSHLKLQIQKEEQKRHEAERAKETMGEMLNCIREILSQKQDLDAQTKEKLASLGSPFSSAVRGPAVAPRLAPIEESGGSLSDVSFDHTADDLFESSCTDPFSNSSRSQARVRKRRSRQRGGGAEVPPRKKSSLDKVESPDRFDAPLANSTSLDVNDAPALKITEAEKHRDENTPPMAIAGPSRPMTRQFSRALDVDLGTTGSFLAATPSQVTLTPSSSKLSRTPSSAVGMRHILSASKLNNRPHIFVRKTTIRPESCQPCNKRIKFYSTVLKCQDCAATCHVECKDKVPIPCVPTINTPRHKHGQNTIAEYTPSVPPMVPALIIYCCSEIEARGMNDMGLYRVSGPVMQVKELKEKILKGKGTPNLSKVDIHVLCSVVKKFLADLSDPLIPKSLWKEFVMSAEMANSQDDKSGIYQAISQLPQPNRDTLAYLMLHLQRVAESPECLMPTENLAKVFGPTLVGYSIPDPPQALAYQETIKQAEVVKCLLGLPSDYWNNFIREDEVSLFPPIVTSADSKQKTPGRHGLGCNTPIGTYDQRLGRTPLGLRNQKPVLRGVGKRQPFFASPMVR